MTLEGVLAEHPFFSEFDARHMQLVVGCAANVSFNAGEMIIRQDRQANAFYLIRTGKVAVEIAVPGRGSFTIQTLGDGEMIGWSWLIPPYRWRFDARAVQTTRAIALDGKCLREKCETDHEMGYELIKRMIGVIGERLDSTRVQLLDLYGDAIE